MHDGGGAPGAAGPDGAPWSVVVRAAAEPASLPVLRGRVERWLRAPGWPADDREDVVLAVNEACANAIDHAYPAGSDGGVELRGRLAPAGGALHRVVVEVGDRGRWRPEPSDPGSRGHGLRVMRACLDRVEIRTTGTGTTVAMTGRPVALRRALVGRRSSRLRGEAAAGVERAREVCARAGAIAQRSARLVRQSLRLQVERGRAARGR